MKTIIEQRWDVYRAERDRLLARAYLHMEQDARICAAWLFGSLGRGDADVLSDIDLFVVVDDAHFEAIVRERYAYMACLDEPVLLLEAPQNWPPGGVYNMALYPGAYGPHQVDWYWVRRSAAKRPTEILLWFDRVGLPAQDSPTRFSYASVPERSLSEIASQAVNMFWVMLLITAKYLAREPAKEMELLASVESSYSEVAAFTASTVTFPAQSTTPQTPLEKIRLLRQCARAMEQLMPAVVTQGGYIPVNFPIQAHRYLDLIEASL
jgi:predicted nucleotidyltransferase